MSDKTLCNYTPVLDMIVNDIGMAPAIVFGAIWRYCQMEHNVCKASQRKIADRAGISVSSVKRHIKLLIEKGYLKEIGTSTGGVKVYKDTNKAFTNTPVKVDYHEYLKTHKWIIKADNAKERADFRCQLCNTRGIFSTLHAHHRTYERLGNELPEDITVLCAKCHALFHGKETV